MLRDGQGLGSPIFHHEEREGHEVSRRLEAVVRDVIDGGLKVHKALGPGLLESVYEHCLAHELQQRGHRLRRQVVLPVFYEELKLDAGYRLDLIIEDSIVVEVKAVDALLRVHSAQLLTYLKLSHCHVGLLMNFNVELFKDGLKRLVL